MRMVRRPEESDHGINKYLFNQGRRQTTEATYFRSRTGQAEWISKVNPSMDVPEVLPGMGPGFALKGSRLSFWTKSLSTWALIAGISISHTYCTDVLCNRGRLLKIGPCSFRSTMLLSTDF